MKKYTLSPLIDLSCRNLKNLGETQSPVSEITSIERRTYDVINENFDALARARRDARGSVDCQYVRQWPEVYVYWSWLISDKWLWRYEWWSEITKWHLDDVMVGWSGWKGVCIHSWSWQRYCENLEMIADSVFDISSTQNSYRKK